MNATMVAGRGRVAAGSEGLHRVAMKIIEGAARSRRVSAGVRSIGMERCAIFSPCYKHCKIVDTQIKDNQTFSSRAESTDALLRNRKERKKKLFLIYIQNKCAGAGERPPCRIYVPCWGNWTFLFLLDNFMNRGHFICFRVQQKKNVTNKAQNVELTFIYSYRYCVKNTSQRKKLLASEAAFVLTVFFFLGRVHGQALVSAPSILFQ